MNLKPSRQLLGAAAFVLLGAAASAAEITLLAPGGIKAAVEQLIPAFEENTGHKVLASFGSGNATKARVLRGDAFDVPIVQQPYAQVMASGHVNAASETPLAHVAVGVAVRTGTPYPDISTADAVKRLLLATRAIAYPDPGGGAVAGASFEATLKQLGIADQMRPKVKLTLGREAAMAALAKGEADVGITFISEIVTEPGVELVGPLPESISPVTRLAAFVGTRTAVPDAAQALARHLSSTEAAGVYCALGMVPAGARAACPKAAR